MKALFKLAAVALTVSLGVSAPSAQAADPVPSVLKVGTCPGPYRGMIETFIEPKLKAQGYTLEYVDFIDYVQPDAALDSGDIDVNLMQHQSYLDAIVKNQGLKLSAVINVPTLGLGVFSDKYKTIDELPDGARIGIPVDAVNLARALRIAKENGLISLNSERDEQKASVADIAENPKHLEFVPIEAAQISRSLDSLDAGFVPGNYAVAAKLDYSKALAVEDVRENIKNVIAVRTADKDTIGKLFLDVVKAPEFKKELEADHYYDSFSRPSWWNK